MKKFGIIPNLEKDTFLSVTQEVFDFIMSKGYTPLLQHNIAEAIGRAEFGFSEEVLYKDSDVLVVLGGDGTLLNVGRRAAVYNTPLIGINLGTLGFLTDVERHDYEAALEKVIAGNYKIEKRIMIEAVLETTDGSEKFLALNDICVTRGALAKIVRLRVSVGGEYLDSYSADGILVATPTGSTAYNLSAGGPIIKPDTKMLALTPICPHILSARSIVVSADDNITIEVAENSKGDLILSVDGQFGGPVKYGDTICVKKSDYYVSIIKTNNQGFYEVLRKKLTKSEGE